MKIDINLKLELHAKWLLDEEEGERLDLSGQDLRDVIFPKGSNLEGSNLSRSNLEGSNLEGSNLSRSNLSRSNLEGSNLSWSNLSRSNLEGSNLSRSNLSWSNLEGSNLEGSNLDFSCWPFHCKSFHVKADVRLVAQLAKHLAMLDVSLCCKGIQEAMEHFRSTGLAHLFDEFRGDLQKTPVSGGSE